MNSGNSNIYLRFSRTARNLILICPMLYIVLTIRQLQCLLCPEANIVCTRVVQRFLRFSHPQTTQENPQNLRLKNHNLLYKYNPVSEAILQKRKPRSNYHIIEIMCCLCILYDRLIISDKRTYLFVHFVDFEQFLLSLYRE